MKRLVLSIAVLILAAGPLSAETISRIAAIVNQDIITTAQLDREIDKMLSAEARETGIPTAQRDAMRQKILDKLIEDTLLRQRIEKLGLKVSDEDLEQAINDVQAQNNITREQLKEALAAQGMSFEEYREQLRQQLLNFKLVGREIQSKVEITNTEMRDYYRAHLEDFRNEPFIRLSRITFRLAPGHTASDIATMRGMAADALNQLRQGKDFLEVLMQYATTAGVDGGDMGKITEGSLSESFNRAVEGLAAGQVSDVIETPEGFHILRLEERNPGETQTFESVKEQIHKKMLEDKRAEAFAEWTENLRKEADIEKRL
ncbi:MAG: peptidyl-prolyl cis-trans isomerase SurA [Desulfuromonadales bacterium]|nr:peptidyl-prolyl cis-trans isomerase SurA [Desulfuromonadales bacterium]